MPHRVRVPNGGGSNPISVSLSTVEWLPSGNGTRLTYTEQGAYFDDETRRVT